MCDALLCFFGRLLVKCRRSAVVGALALRTGVELPGGPAGARGSAHVDMPVRALVRCGHRGGEPASVAAAFFFFLVLTLWSVRVPVLFFFFYVLAGLLL